MINKRNPSAPGSFAGEFNRKIESSQQSRDILASVPESPRILESAESTEDKKAVVVQRVNRPADLPRPKRPIQNPIIPKNLYFIFKI